MAGLCTIMGKLDCHSRKVLFGIAVSTSDFAVWGLYVIFSLHLSMKGKEKLGREFFYLFNKYLLYTYYVADIAIGAGSTELIKFKKQITAFVRRNTIQNKIQIQNTKQILYV